MGGSAAESFSKEIFHNGKKKIVINQEQVKFMNSSGLGILISGLNTVK